MDFGAFLSGAKGLAMGPSISASMSYGYYWFCLHCGGSSSASGQLQWSTGEGFPILISHSVTN